MQMFGTRIIPISTDVADRRGRLLVQVEKTSPAPESRCDLIRALNKEKAELITSSARLFTLTILVIHRIQTFRQ